MLLDNRDPHTTPASILCTLWFGPIEPVGWRQRMWPVYEFPVMVMTLCLRLPANRYPVLLVDTTRTTYLHAY